MLADDRLEGPVGGDDAIGRFRADPNGAAKRQIAGPLEPGPAWVGGAELLEPLRVQHERRRARRATARVAEHARAQAMDDVDLAVADELPGKSARAQPEERVRRASIDHRRPAPSRQRERPIRDRCERDPWMNLVGRVAFLGCSRDERRLDAGFGQIAHEVIDVALEAAESMQREHGSGDDGDANHGPTCS